jgi:hypothetical protein
MPLAFKDVSNAQKFLETNDFEREQQVETPQSKLNKYLNDIYNEISKEAFELDSY